MELTTSLHTSICALFEVHPDELGVQRVVTPMEYSGSGDRVVIRVRPTTNGYQIDENGEAGFYASMAEGDLDSESVARWAADLAGNSPVSLDEEEKLVAFAQDESLVPAYIFRVAEAAQQLFALATSRQPRRVNEFKNLVAAAVNDACRTQGFTYASNVVLPIAGDFLADHVIDAPTPLIVIAATGIQRLLEAELIHMRYQAERIPAFILATVENQKSVGAKQFERANYYTGKTVSFSSRDFTSLLRSRLND